MSKPSHCKECKHFHNAHHPTKSPLAKRYNNWCCHFSKPAADAIGQCKLKNGKSYE